VLKRSRRLPEAISILAFLLPLPLLFPLYPLSMFVLIGSLFETALSAAVSALLLREQIHPAQRKKAEFLIRAVGLPLTVVCFAGSSTLPMAGAMRLILCSALLAAFSIKRAVSLVALFAVGIVLFTVARSFPEFPYFDFSHLYIAVSLSALAIIAARAGFVFAARVRRSRATARAALRHARKVEERTTLFVARSVGTEDATSFLRVGSIPSRESTAALVSLYMYDVVDAASSFGPDAHRSAFDAEWDGFTGRLVSLGERLRAQAQWDGDALRFRLKSMSEAFGLAQELLQFVRRTSLHQQTQGRRWVTSVCVVSEGSLFQLAGAPEMPLALLRGPLREDHEQFIRSLTDRDLEILTGEFLPVVPASFHPPGLERRPFGDWAIAHRPGGS